MTQIVSLDGVTDRFSKIEISEVDSKIAVEFHYKGLVLPDEEKPYFRLLEHFSADRDRLRKIVEKDGLLFINMGCEIGPRRRDVPYTLVPVERADAADNIQDMDDAITDRYPGATCEISEIIYDEEAEKRAPLILGLQMRPTDFSILEAKVATHDGTWARHFASLFARSKITLPVECMLQ